jgi:hypothetical protein
MTTMYLVALNVSQSYGPVLAAVAQPLTPSEIAIVVVICVVCIAVSVCLLYFMTRAFRQAFCAHD